VTATIGFGSPNKAVSYSVHGAALVGTDVTLMSNAHPNCRVDPGRRAQEISQKNAAGIFLRKSQAPISQLLLREPTYFEALMMGLGLARMMQRHLFVTIHTNVSFGNLEVFGLKGSPPQAVLVGKEEIQKLRKLRETFLSRPRKRFRNRQLADNGVATDDTGCNSVQYEGSSHVQMNMRGVTSAYIDLGTAPEITYEEPF
ncbi:hypothetical protein Tco_1199225, partial [Tanacetum coccineum]